MTARRDHITIFEAELNMAEVARALWVTEEVALLEMKDARVASRWAEHWGAHVGVTVKSANTNEPDYDLSGQVGNSKIRVSNKCLTKSGVKFQDSKYVGSGRKCEMSNVESSLDAVDLIQVVDISQMPVARIMTVHSRHLRAEVRAGRLGCGGWKADAFYDFIDRTYDHDVQRITLDGRPIAEGSDSLAEMNDAAA